MGDAEPLRHHHEQGPAILTAKHAGEAGLLELDPLPDLTTLENAPARRTALVHDGAPDGPFDVEADAIALTRSAEVGPDTAIGEAAVGGDVEGGEFAAE